jgi:hypothetical protein
LEDRPGPLIGFSERRGMIERICSAVNSPGVPRAIVRRVDLIW